LQSAQIFPLISYGTKEQKKIAIANSLSVGKMPEDIFKIIFLFIQIKDSKIFFTAKLKIKGRMSSSPSASISHTLSWIFFTLLTFLIQPVANSLYPYQTQPE